MKNIFKTLPVRPQLLIALLFMATVAGVAWYYYGQVRTIPTSADTLSGLVGPSATCDYYTAPAVISGGDGSEGNPWDLQSALNTELMVSGKTLCLKGGTYYGKFTSTLNGGTVQSAPGEWAVIDGNYTTTLVGAIDASQESFVLADASQLYEGASLEIWVDDELITILGKSGNTITYSIRGVQGTVGGAQAHADGATVRLVYSQQLLISGDDTTYRDFEVTSSLPNRTTIWGKMRGGGVSIFPGDGNSLINLIVHDTVTGIFTGSSSSNTLLYGNIVYNNGMKTMAPYYDGEARGGNMYLENVSGYSRVYETISINGFTFNGQFFGVSGPYVGGDMQGSVFANSGAPMEVEVPGMMPNLYIGTGSQQIPYASVDSTYIWHRAEANTGNLTMGYGSGMADGDVTNSIFVGSLNGVEFKPGVGVFTGNTFSSSDTDARYITIPNNTPYTFDNNTYYDTSAPDYRFIVTSSGQPGTWDSWRSYTGFDTNSTVSAEAMPDTVIVRPNQYQAGRANITIFARSNPSSINVNLSNSGLTNGQTYEIRNSFDFFGDLVASGTYNSSSPTISVSLTGAAQDVAEPTGLGYTPVTTCPEFCSMVLLPTSSVVTPTGDTTPPVLSSGSPSGSQPAGTTSTNLTLSTNETATCKYGTTANVAYASLPSTFTTTNSTSHSTTISSLSNGTSYTYYIRCQDTASNPTTQDFTISFSVATTTTTPPSTGGGGGSGGGGGGTTIPSTTTVGMKLVNSNGTYYLIQSGQRKGITSPGILYSCGFDFSNAQTATASDNALPSGGLLLPCGGALVKSAEDQTVYLVSLGKRYAFTSAQVFLAQGHKFSSVLTVTNPELQALPKNADISNGSQAHLPDTDINVNGTIYWISGSGTKHPYPSLGVYNSWHIDGDFSKVVPANQNDLNLTTGSNVPMRVVQ